MPDDDVFAIPAAPPVVRGASRSGHVAAMAALIGMAATAILRLALIFRFRIDSDETQHLHIVWGWAHGLLPYRDFFDNHMPLFHMLAVPLLRLAGERPETLFLVRLAMLPLFVAMVLLTYQIGISCYPKRAVIGAMVIGTFAPDFFLCSVEFRTDVLWGATWLTAIAILVRAPITPRRAAAAGLFVGIAAAVSAKTSLLAACLALAAFVTLLLTFDRGEPLRHLGKCAIGFVAAALVPIGSVATYFFTRGAWKQFVYCVATHNLTASEHKGRLLLLPLSLIIIAGVTQRILRDDIPTPVLRRRLFLFLTAFIYVAAMISLWPIVEKEHWIPCYPVAAVAVVPLLLPERHWPRLLLIVLALELLWIARVSTPWRDRATPSAAVIEEAMALTGPAESVIDVKGEIVFRRRAFFYVYEKLTKKAIVEGHIRDTIAADVLRTGAMVAVPDNPSFPRDGRAFLLRNFVRAGCLRVAGVMVRGSRTFDIEIPGQYAVVSEHGRFQGALDGAAYAGPRFLGAGHHTLANVASRGHAAVMWQRAAALGFSPFVRESRCAEDGF